MDHRDSWLIMALLDIKIRYRRSVIGPFWITLSVAIFVSALAVVYSSLFKVELKEYMPFITIGMIIWTYISVVILEGCSAYVDAQMIISNTNIPLITFVLRVIVRNSIVFAHNLIVLIVVIWAFDVQLTLVTLLSLIGLLVILLNSIWVAIFFSILATRYRDIQPLITSILQVLFLITPIFWSVEMLSEERDILANANVLYHFVEIFRAPILGKVPSDTTFVVVSFVTVFGWLLAIKVYNQFSRKVPYWI